MLKVIYSFTCDGCAGPIVPMEDYSVCATSPIPQPQYVDKFGTAHLCQECMSAARRGIKERMESLKV